MMIKILVAGLALLGASGSASADPGSVFAPSLGNMDIHPKLAAMPAVDNQAAVGAASPSDEVRRKGILVMEQAFISDDLYDVYSADILIETPENRVVVRQLLRSHNMHGKVHRYPDSRRYVPQLRYDDKSNTVTWEGDIVAKCSKSWIWGYQCAFDNKYRLAASVENKINGADVDVSFRVWLVKGQ